MLAIEENENIGSPILVTSDMKIIDGHTRFRIAKTLNHKDIQAVIVPSIIRDIEIDDIQETY